MTESNTTNSEAVIVSALTKTYKGSDVSALNGISFSVTKGEVFGLIGPNGAGKTTLIGCLLGLLRPDSGTISIFGLAADSLAVRRITGYVPERSDFEHWMTARQFLKYHHGLAGRNAKGADREIDECLEAVQLSSSVWNRRLKTYSRGMLQRLNIAQMLIGKPSLALLDEPTLGLDPNGVTLVRNILRKMQEDGVTVIVNSHQLDEVERVCDRVAFIKQGKIASIENIKTGAVSRYSLLVRWPESSLNGSLNAVVETCAEKASVSVEECHHSWGRFSVQNNKAAANLIKELISNGLPVEEAVPEKNRLEELFVSGGDNNENE